MQQTCADEEYFRAVSRCCWQSFLWTVSKVQNEGAKRNPVQQETDLEGDSGDDRAVSVQQASVVHIIPFPLLRQPAHPLGKVMDVAVLLIEGLHAPLLFAGLGAQVC